MKIGILTYHRATNYGAVLQAYSLVNYIKKKFPNDNVEIIDYSTVSAKKSHLNSIIRYLLKCDLKSAIGEFRKNMMFKAFSDKLPVSTYKIVSDRSDSIDEYINKNYDVVITGSDAIFSWAGKRFPTAYFLHDIKGPKLSYAASAHRLFYKSEDESKLAWAQESFNSFSYVGVRDLETENFLRYSGYKGEIFHNCDPTFLLNIKDIHNNVNIDDLKKKCGIKEGVPVCVFMSSNPEIGKAIKDHFGASYQVIPVFINNPSFENTVYTLTPFEWATLFSIATFTVTDYFHATILSLLNLTPVLSIDNLFSDTGYEGKIKDLLLRRLDMPEIYINGYDLQRDGYDVMASLVDNILCKITKSMIQYKIDNERMFADSFIKQLSYFVNKQ